MHYRSCPRLDNASVGWESGMHGGDCGAAGASGRDAVVELERQQVNKSERRHQHDRVSGLNLKHSQQQHTVNTRQVNSIQ